MSTWSSQYRDVRWQKKRLEIMERDEFTCLSCGKKEGTTLNVHHIYYEKNKKPWDYDSTLLVTWCDDCHKQRHSLQKELLIELSLVSVDEIKSVLLMLGMSPHSLNIVASLYLSGHCGKIDNKLIKMIGSKEIKP